MLWTAFTIGLFGSLHCIGMCGPIAMAIPSPSNRRSILQSSLLYNLGRAITYGMMGLLIGIIGKGILLAGLQKWLSILTGVMILLVLIFSINFEKKIIQLPFFNQLFFQLKSRLGNILQRQSNLATLSTGLLNGLLPCGLVYIALAGALSASSLWESGLFMFTFGLGTMPLMLLFLAVGKSSLIRNYRIALRRLYPVFMVLLAFWFIYRGVHFYLPPDFRLSSSMSFMPLCH